MVALKPGDRAKSRLHSLPAELRRELAAAMAVDTLRALSAAVDHVLVVGQTPDPELGPGLVVEQILEPETPGLNAALSHGAALLRGRGTRVVLACVGDLPALRAESVRRALDAALSHPRSFLSDASGVGTTMLIAHDSELDPRFGGASARAHAISGAHALTTSELTAVDDARTDVDNEVDLVIASRLGLGDATRAVLERAGWPAPTA